jgi:phage protein D
MVTSTVLLTIDGEIVKVDDILSLSFDDASGSKSDKVSVQVVPNFKRPAPNSKLELTFKSFNNGVLKDELVCGLFHTQKVTRTNNKALSFTATGVEFNDKQKEKLSFNYKDTKLSTIVGIVATRLGHKLKFDSDDLTIKSLNQTNETDINFLDRLAKDYNVTFSIKNDILYFVNKDNESLPISTVNISFCGSSSFSHSTKKYYKSCEASWHDNEEAKTLTVSVFSGTPVLKIKGSYHSTKEATVKAKAKLLQTNKGIIKASFSTRGFKLYAGTKANVIDTYENEDDGIYSVETCKHTFTRAKGWNTSGELEN